VSSLRGKHVLVTGGSGFIGRVIVRRLLDQGAEVTVGDLLPSPVPGVREVVGDLRDAATREAALAPGTDAVLHLAALTSVLKSIQQPWEVYRSNVEMTSGLLERAREVGCGRFVAASTNAVVGDVGRSRITEDLPLQPLTPYGATKAAAEMLMSAYTASYDVACCPLRLSNVFGPEMGHKDSMVPRLMKAALRGDTVEIYGDGEQVRDFVHVYDVAAAFLLAASDGWTGPTIIAGGRSYSVNELVAMTREVTGHELPTVNVPAKQGERPAVIVDPARAHSLGWKPEVSMRDGLEIAWSYFRELPEETAS
jgi:UDP-glucose 4-epimerase